MIKNEKQYKITKKRLAEVEQIIAAKQPLAKPNSIQEGAIGSLVLLKNNLKEEIKQYESLKTKGIPLRRSVSVMQLPNILIQYKIAKGFTQKQYSEILGIKEQQLQRYEAENYASVSFGRLMDYVEKAKIKIKLAVEA
jgi:DNA-binding XRE family transcriptional regulator